MQNTGLSSGSVAGVLAGGGNCTTLGYNGTTHSGLTTLGTGLGTSTGTWPTLEYPLITHGDFRLPSIPTSFNISNTKNMQSKLAIFKVERDEKGEVKSSTFVKEFWVEKLQNVSIELLAVKELEPGFEPNDIVVRELHTVYL